VKLESPRPGGLLGVVRGAARPVIGGGREGTDEAKVAPGPDAVDGTLNIIGVWSFLI